ncbi:MAG: photosystem II stability/assembly factor-like protein [Phenylobacterium sp.]
MTRISRRAVMAGVLPAAAMVASGLEAAAGVEALASGVGDELRGLSLAGGAVWLSGNHGTVVVDGRVRRPPGAEALDFRGLHAFSPTEALATSAGPGAASTLWRTSDAGLSWTRTRVNDDPAGFWDAIAFAGRRRGFILGDPTQGRFTLLRTTDGGASWTRATAESLPPLAGDEAAYAASNGSLAIGPKGQVAFCTGGGPSWARVYLSRDGGARFRALDTPIPAGAPSRGAYAAAFDAAGALWVCGGDYLAPRAQGVNLARLGPGSSLFQAVEAPAGYLSSLAARDGMVIATGLAGTVVSQAGRPFRRVSETPFNTVRLARDGEATLAGPKGAMARWRA